MTLFLDESTLDTSNTSVRKHNNTLINWRLVFELPAVSNMLSQDEELLSFFLHFIR